MLDIKFIRENPDAVKENIKKKFQDAKLPLVDELLDLDAKNRAAITEASDLRASRNALSKQIGMLMGQAKKDPSKLEEAEKVKAQVKAQADRLTELIGTLPPVTDMVNEGMTAEDIAFTVTQGFDMLIENKHAHPMYECKCSRDRMERVLISLGKDELRAIIEEQGEAEMGCRFCDKKYVFSRDELEELYEKARGAK